MVDTHLLVVGFRPNQRQTQSSEKNSIYLRKLQNQTPKVSKYVDILENFKTIELWMPTPLQIHPLYTESAQHD